MKETLLRNYIEKLKKFGKDFFNKNVVRNIIYISCGIILFIAGVIAYGIILNVREISLDEAIRLNGLEELKKVNIVVDRKNYVLMLYEDTILVKSYRASFGRNVGKQKSSKDDGATPVGNYQICSIDTIFKYHKFFKLNYPNLSDISDALRRGRISQAEYDKLRFQFFYDECPSLETNLGGNIGIHGIGRLNSIFKNLPFVYNWTDGSIALSNESIDELYKVVKRGTKVVIR
ncbi:MAG: L,D-transpeptidase [Ignavibacteriaceae bacterium]|nr:L,D-transpeptidase [Ignavibacteriaceae bacterium]